MKAVQTKQTELKKMEKSEQNGEKNLLELALHKKYLVCVGERRLG